ncbi:helix-turn-helix domain-containing protein [Paludibacteraceae bacterium OttesenSCG-928-F17]|nr:helix-turn-helix domain-containing protein [Paludibacteraceae bacterium OttesenSCG-928-F17]
MEIINIDKNTFDEIKSRFQNFRQKVNELCKNKRNKKLDEWLDNQYVCLRLNISPRTLQSYRDNRKIGFSKINHKIYYKASDIEKFLQSNQLNIQQ